MRYKGCGMGMRMRQTVNRCSGSNGHFLEVLVGRPGKFPHGTIDTAHLNRVMDRIGNKTGQKQISRSIASQHRVFS